MNVAAYSLPHCELGERYGKIEIHYKQLFKWLYKKIVFRGQFSISYMLRLNWNDGVSFEYDNHGINTIDLYT